MILQNIIWFYLWRFFFLLEPETSGCRVTLRMFGKDKVALLRSRVSSVELRIKKVSRGRSEAYWVTLRLRFGKGKAGSWAIGGGQHPSLRIMWLSWEEGIRKAYVTKGGRLARPKTELSSLYETEVWEVGLLGYVKKFWGEGGDCVWFSWVEGETRDVAVGFFGYFKKTRRSARLRIMWWVEKVESEKPMSSKVAKERGRRPSCQCRRNPKSLGHRKWKVECRIVIAKKNREGDRRTSC